MAQNHDAFAVVLGGVDELRKMGLGVRERRLTHVTIMTIEVHEDNASASRAGRARPLRRAARGGAPGTAVTCPLGRRVIRSPLLVDIARATRGRVRSGSR